MGQADQRKESQLQEGQKQPAPSQKEQSECNRSSLPSGKGRVLIIAGSDPSGGAGIQADIKTVAALKGYAMTAITALTVQNSLGVTAARFMEPDFVAQQIAACLEDIGADAIKIGMLGNQQIIRAVAGALADFKGPVILDPVMVATSGDRLLDEAAIEALLNELVPRAFVITPNIPEAERLSGLRWQPEDPAEIAASLFDKGAGAVLLKDGHGKGELICDRLYTARGVYIAQKTTRQKTRHTHGTGCTMASALACGLAYGLSLEEAFGYAHDFVQHAIRLAPQFGAGHGPLGHALAGMQVAFPLP